MLEVERGVEHTDKLTVKSDVEQTIYMSAYLYDSQHTRNGDCHDYDGDSYAKIKVPAVDGYSYHFSGGDKHYKEVSIGAG